MHPNPVHRLPAPLEAAVQRIKLAARNAVERSVESLGMAALAAQQAFQRDVLLEAQFELNRRSASFVLTFNDAYDQRVMREAGGVGEVMSGHASTNWDALGLVADRDVEQQISADRFGMDIAHVCEWELRELNGFIAALLGYSGSDKGLNPLRPEIVGFAMMRGIDTISDRPEVRKLLAAEIGRSLGGLLRTCYGDIVADMRQAGVQPLGLSVRLPANRAAGGDMPRPTGVADSVSPAAGEQRTSGHSRSGFDAAQGGPALAGGHHAPTQPAGLGGTRAGTPFGSVDPALMSLMRRLSHAEPIMSFNEASRSGASTTYWGEQFPNVIRAHREELRQASTGTLDHMVIDVIGTLFDQILADPKVPPQMARQIARLQLPVLRAALGDPAFFSSRRHPVRRFINRIASLGAAFDDFDAEPGRSFLLQVRTLVQAVVEGDFDQIETYEAQLKALEGFLAEQADNEARVEGHAAELLSQKEDGLRLRQLYSQRLQGDLKGLAGPEFVREFVSRVWSQVLLRAAEQGGADGPLATRLRHTGRELFMSVQPKATPALRKAFLAQLPKLMQELTGGLNLIGWPETQRRDFFGQLMPAHADALKTVGSSQLDNNLLARQLDSVLERPLPSRAELRTTPSAPATPEAEDPDFSAEEAQRVGLLVEAAVDWSKPVEADTEPADIAADNRLALSGLPALSESTEPSHGRALADQVQVGFAYEMQLQGQWQKVRLSHVSTARSFYVFTHGERHLQTISLTLRMLVRLCEAGRLRAFEAAYLVERATAASCGLQPSGAPCAGPPPGWPGRPDPGRQCRRRCRGPGWCAQTAIPA
jgi:Protein of unknown function (DUF1631)